MPWDERIGRRLKLKDLQTLMTVAETGGMGRAANRLNYSQPAVSQAIATLERTLGKRLLERGRKGIEFTPYGIAVLKGGAAVFDDLRKAVADIDFLSDPTAGDVRIGCTEPVSASIVSVIVNQLARRYPHIKFQITVREPPELYRELSARNIDVVIAQVNRPINEDLLQSEVLQHEPVVIVAGARHPLASKRRLKLIDLVDEPWALPLPESFVSSLLADAFRRDGLNPPRATVITHSAFLRILMVADGHFITAAAPAMLKVAGMQTAIKALTVALPTNQRPVRIVTLKNRALSPVVQNFIEQVRDFTNQTQERAVARRNNQGSGPV